MTKDGRKRSINISWVAYIIGIVLLGLIYERLKIQVDNDIVFFIAIISYVIVLRLIGDFVEHKRNKHRST